MGVALLVLLVACALRIWHLLLVRLLMGWPSEVAWWLAALFALVLVGRALARRRPEARASQGWRWLAGLDWPALALLAFVLLLVWLFDLGFERAASDGREYFVQVRSLVIDRDLDFANENAVFGVRGTAELYAFGAPLLWTPFFLAAHLWLSLANLLGASFALEGFSNPYQRAIGLGTLVYGAVGLALIFRILTGYFSRGLSALAVIGLTAGSFLVWYLTVDNAMVHGVSMYATTLFLFLWHRAGRAPTRGQWAGMGAAAGLMTLVRWQNVLFAAVPLVLLVWDVFGRERAGTVQRPLRTAAAGVLTMAAAGAVVFLPQLVFWKAVRGSWFAIPAAEHGVATANLHVADVLFSSNHGLLAWSPVVYLALPGLLLFFRRDWRLAAVLMAGLGAQLYINSAVEVWWGGAGFGARRFANCALVFAVGLSAGLDWARRRPLAVPGAVLASFVLLNATMMLDVRRGRLPASQGITFDEILGSAYTRVGNPFSFPMNAWVAWRYGGDATLYDRLRGRTYTNLSIDVGEPADEPFLTTGWSGRERAPDVSFRWSAGPSSSLVVPLGAPADYVLTLRCAAFSFPGSPTQTLGVVANGTAVGTLRIEPGFGEQSVPVPAAALRAGLNRIEFRYGYTRSPRAAGLGADPRELAVQCDWIRLTRR